MQDEYFDVVWCSGVLHHTKDSKKGFEILTTLPGVGAKSAKALFEAGFKTTKAVIAADEKELLAVSGVGINLVKKLKKLK